MASLQNSEMKKEKKYKRGKSSAKESDEDCGGKGQELDLKSFEREILSKVVGMVNVHGGKLEGVRCESCSGSCNSGLKRNWIRYRGLECFWKGYQCFRPAIG